MAPRAATRKRRTRKILARRMVRQRDPANGVASREREAPTGAGTEARTARGRGAGAGAAAGAGRGAAAGLGGGAGAAGMTAGETEAGRLIGIVVGRGQGAGERGIDPARGRGTGTGGGGEARLRAEAGAGKRRRTRGEGRRSTALKVYSSAMRVTLSSPNLKNRRSWRQRRKVTPRLLLRPCHLPPVRQPQLLLSRLASPALSQTPRSHSNNNFSGSPCSPQTS
mmetsp:Transcript_22805/g.51416  ORF Transcript_22805/g.51416 Transcript_22805/m.51416 type:complete len:224 (+) Transcript_22805:129-800(+)